MSGVVNYTAPLILPGLSDMSGADETVSFIMQKVMFSRQCSQPDDRNMQCLLRPRLRNGMLSFLLHSVGQSNSQASPNSREIDSIASLRENAATEQNVCIRWWVKNCGHSCDLLQAQKIIEIQWVTLHFLTFPISLLNGWSTVVSRLSWKDLRKKKFLNLKDFCFCETWSPPANWRCYTRAFGSDINFHLVPSVSHCYLVQTSFKSSLEFKKKQENFTNIFSYYITIFGQEIYTVLIYIFKNFSSNVCWNKIKN